MPATPNRHIVPGSERSVMPGATVSSDVAPDERFEVAVRLRAKPSSRGLAEGGAHDDRPPAVVRGLLANDRMSYSLLVPEPAASLLFALWSR
jgi:hypothetical protein